MPGASVPKPSSQGSVPEPVEELDRLAGLGRPNPQATISLSGEAERARLLREAELAEATYRHLFEAVVDPVLVCDQDWVIEDANAAAQAAFGYGRDDLLYRSLLELCEDPTWTVEAGEHLAQESDFRTEFVGRRLNGSTFPVEARARAVQLLGGTVYLVLARDISEQRAFEQLQQEFLDGVAHDLRNPLTTIKGQAQLLWRQARRHGAIDPDRLASGLQTIESGVSQMTAQIAELQDVARLRTGRPLELQTAPTDLLWLVQEAVAGVAQTSERHQIRVHPPEGASGQIIGRWDPVRLRRVLDNLLGNAVKYSPAGGEIDVTITFDPHHRPGDAPDGPGGPWVHLSVRDRGVGIPEGDLSLVFERFRRGSNVAGRIRGTGIGLAGARQIVEQHGGAITVASREGEGSTFTVSLPLTVASAG